MAQPRLFISYSRVDGTTAAQIAEQLKRAYDHVWFDEWLHGGEDWWAEILTQINTCDIFIYLLSRESIESSYCQAEYAEAQRLRKQILPVLIRARTDLPDSLKKIQYVDISKGLTSAVGDLLASVVRLADKLPAVPPPPTTPQPMPMPAVMDKSRTSWRGVVIGVIALVAVIGLLAIVFLQGGQNANPTAMPTASATFTLTNIPSPTPTGTFTPTVVSTPTLTNTPMVTVTPTPAPGVKRTDEHGIAQVYVPAGCFMMGSAPAKDMKAGSDEQPQHQVCLAQGYWIDAYEVTNVDYQKFISNESYGKQQYWSVEGWQWVQKYNIQGPENYAGFTDPQQPRIGVSWYEADAYARWRGGRLPTEAEWEYAARGPDSLIYPWGNTWDSSRANTYESSYRKTKPVGSYESGKSWIGANDLAGNVWEWVVDWYDGNYYRQQVKGDPEGLVSGQYRGLRGGSWGLSRSYARAAARGSGLPEDRGYDFGFRVVVVGARPPSLAPH